jgi:hypothetical protein
LHCFALLRTTLLFLVLPLAAAAPARAQGGCDNDGCPVTPPTTTAPNQSVPEIDPSLGMGAAALLGGAALVVRGRLKR